MGPEFLEFAHFLINYYFHPDEFEELKNAVGRFTDYVVMHPQNKFMLTAVGCGAACYSENQIAPLFSQAYSFGNVYVPQSFLPYVSPKNPNV